jgi:predicted ATP-binding protein involved in virulence
MRIDKLHIQNFKGFEDETFHLNPHYTVFIGENGAGKTSVLDAIAVVLASYFIGIDGAGSAVRNIRPNEVRVMMIDGLPRPQFPCLISASGELNGQRIESGWFFESTRINDAGGTGGGIGTWTIAPIIEKMVQESRSVGGVTFPVIAYHGTGRLWAQHGEKHPEFRKQEEGIAMAYQDCLLPESSSKDFLSWYKTYQYEAINIGGEEDKLQVRIFNECILSFIPGDWDSMAYSFKDENLIFVRKKGSAEEKNLLFTQLSDGYRNVIGMVADIAYRCIKLNPHLGENAIKETPGIVLIDELDLHLHPKWQRHIVRDLKKAFPKVQFVATTHSPFIVQSLESDELVNLDRITDVDPQDLSLELVAEEIMDVRSVFSEKNQELEQVGLDYFKLLEEAVNSEEKGEYKEKLEAYERAIDDPGLRAFFKSNRIAKNIL